MRMASSSLVLVSKDLFMKPKVLKCVGHFKSFVASTMRLMMFALLCHQVLFIISYLNDMESFVSVFLSKKNIKYRILILFASLRIKISVVCLKEKVLLFFVVVVVNLSIEQLKTKRQFSGSKSKKTKTKIHHHRRSWNHRPSWSPRPCRQPKTAFLKSFL